MFKTLNIENDPIEQGFEPDTYDVIIAANVIHATASVDRTLSNCLKMLKKGGKLILYEATNPDTIRWGFFWGLLSGWWLSSEPHRRWGPLMSAPQWDMHLKRAGFSGVDLEFADYASKANHLHGVLVSTKPDDNARSASRALPDTLVVFNETSQLQTDVMSEILEKMPTAQSISLSNLSGAQFSSKLVIFLGELDSPLLDRLDEATFAALQKMTTTLKSLVWLTGGGGASPSHPDREIVTGFARVIRQENPTLNFITLAIDEIRSAAAAAAAVLRTIDSALGKQTRSSKSPDNTFWESKGVIHIPRLVEASDMNIALARKTTGQTAVPRRFGGEEALRLQVGSPGQLDTLRFARDAAHDAPLQDGEVEFKVAAAGLDELDLMIALGQHAGDNLGREGAGTVTRTGTNTSRFAVGDRVCGLARGTLGTFARTRQTSLARVPPGMSTACAAGFTTAYATAYAALVDAAAIQPRETVLVHEAAGAVGQACVQLARMRGAEVIAAVGPAAERELLVRAYGLPLHHILSKREISLARGVRNLTGGRGADVAVDTLAGDAFRATWECMAPFGRFVEVGRTSAHSSARLDMSLFKNCVRFQCVDISLIESSNPPRFANIMQNLMTLVEAGKIGALEPIQEFAFGNMQEGFRLLESGEHSGKIILVPGEEDEVPVSTPLPSWRPAFLLAPQAVADNLSL